jgi:hypothetical protein
VEVEVPEEVLLSLEVLVSEAVLVELDVSVDVAVSASTHVEKGRVAAIHPYGGGAVEADKLGLRT